MWTKILSTAIAVTAFGLTSFAQPPQFSRFVVSPDSCYANSQNRNYAYGFGTISNAVANLRVKTYWGDGSFDDVNVQTQGNTGNFQASHIYASPGTYTTMAVLFDANNNPKDTSRLTINVFCTVLWGVVYKKNDANCIYNEGIDLPLNFPLKVEVRKNNVAIDTFITNGNFAYKVPSPDQTSEYSLHPVNIDGGYQLACPSVSTPYRVRLDTLQYMNGTPGFNYGFECDNNNTGFDLFAYMTGMFRFTATSYINISVGNAACSPHDGTLTLNISPKYTFTSASQPPTSVSGQTVTWNLQNLSGTSSTYIYVTLKASDTLTPGDTTCNKVSILPTSGDINTSNNTFSACDSIRASFDPNEKHVAPLGDIEAGQLLTYTINFENLGNDTAFNIHVLDTLSANLDLSTFELLNSSHPVSTNMLDYENNKVVRFDFKDINLQDKDHPETNKGFVIYQAKAKNNLVKGDEIANTAYIYFDINPAIVTNTVVSKIPIANSITGLQQEDGITVYPNPTKDELFLNNKSGTFREVVIFNTLGQTVLAQVLTPGLNGINMKRIAPGLYYLILQGKEGARSIKVTKQ